MQSNLSNVWGRRDIIRRNINTMIVFRRTNIIFFWCSFGADRFDDRVHIYLQITWRYR